MKSVRYLVGWSYFYMAMCSIHRGLWELEKCHSELFIIHGLVSVDKTVVGSYKDQGSWECLVSALHQLRCELGENK